MILASGKKSFGLVEYILWKHLVNQSASKDDIQILCFDDLVVPERFNEELKKKLDSIQELKDKENLFEDNVVNIAPDMAGLPPIGELYSIPNLESITDFVKEVAE